MQNLFLTVDKVSTFIGHCFSWLVVGLTALIGFEVFSRYVLNSPHAWAFDAQIMMYGTMFMMAGAYTLSKNGHVRGDVLYGFFPPRLQAALDLALGRHPRARRAGDAAVVEPRRAGHAVRERLARAEGQRVRARPRAAHILGERGVDRSHLGSPSAA